MANTDFNTAWSANPKNATALLTASEKRGVYVIADAETPASLTPGNVLYLGYQGRVFRYDATDSLTANDGVTCIVTSDGKRFKADNYAGSQKRIWQVKSMAVATPPVSPTNGDHYVVAAGGTGAWAGKDNYVAVKTARSWVFIAPNLYDMVFNDADGLTYYYNSLGAWTSGWPGIVNGDSSISLRSLKYNKLGLSIVNQTTNAPPGSPSDGNAYIVGGSPTGAWSGKARQVAIWEVSAWVFYAPYEGATVYDTTVNAQVVYDESVWTTLVAGYSQVTAARTAATENSANLTDVNFSETTAPTAASSKHSDSVTLTHTAKAAGKFLEIEYSCFFRANMTGGSVSPTMTANNLQVGIQVDSAASMADWWLLPLNDPQRTTNGNGPWHQVNATFRIAAADAASHVYTACFFLDVALASSGLTATADIDIARRTFIIREVS